MDVAQGREYVLTLSCPDKPGIVYAVSSFLVQHSGNILDSQQYGESPDGHFFMRVHFSVPPQSQSPEESLAGLQHGFSWVAESFHMSWQLHDQAARIRTARSTDCTDCAASATALLIAQHYSRPVVCHTESMCRRSAKCALGGISARCSGIARRTRSLPA